MKTLLENWRQYQGEYNFDILCENRARGLISEARFLETWEKQVLTEMDQLLDEGVMDVLKIGYEKGRQLVGKAKQAWDVAIEKVGQFNEKLSLQAWKLIQTIKRGLAKVAAVLQKALGFIGKFCKAHPILCKATKILLMMFAIIAVMIFFSSEAQAAVDVSAMPGEGAGATLNDTGVDAIKGFLEIAAQDNSPEHQQLAADGFKWIEQAHNSETLVDLAEAQADGAKLVRSLFEQLREIQTDSELGNEAVQQLAKIGENVVLTSKSVTKQIYDSAQGLENTRIEWESLRAVSP